METMPSERTNKILATDPGSILPTEPAEPEEQMIEKSA